MKGIIAGVVLLFTGVVLVGVGFVVYAALQSGEAALASVPGGMHGGPSGIDVGLAFALPSMILWGVGGLLILLGIPMLLFGIMRTAARRNELQQIATSGVEAQGVISFLD